MKDIFKTVITIVIVSLILLLTYNIFSRETTVYLRCPYSSYSVVSQEIKDRANRIFKLNKKDNKDIFSGADGLHYSVEYKSDNVVDVTAIGYEDSNDTRIFTIELKK